MLIKAVYFAAAWQRLRASATTNNVSATAAASHRAHPQPWPLVGYCWRGGCRKMNVTSCPLVLFHLACCCLLLLLLILSVLLLRQLCLSATTNDISATLATTTSTAALQQWLRLRRCLRLWQQLHLKRWRLLRMTTTATCDVWFDGSTAKYILAPTVMHGIVERLVRNRNEIVNVLKNCGGWVDLKMAWVKSDLVGNPFLLYQRKSGGLQN